MFHRLLPIGLIIAFFAFIAFNLQPIRRTIAYNDYTRNFALATGISNDTTLSCCYPEVVENSSGNFDEDAAIAIYNNQVIDYPKTSLAYNATAQGDADTQVLGLESLSPTRWIEVSLKDQILRAWDGNKIVMEFAISSGKWYPTPKGDYNIWYKTRSQTMSGGSKDLGTYYYLPGVPHNMFFKSGFAIHGAYWHNNFGQPMSHGCVNAPLPNVAQLFEWAGPVVPPGKNAVKATPENPGTRVFVH